MRWYQHIVGSMQLKKIDIPKPISILHIKWFKFTPLLSAATPLHRWHSSLSVKIATSTMSVSESSLASHYLNFCQALASMEQTMSFSLTICSTFYFNLGTNLFHMYPLSNDVPCNSHIIRIMKKTTHVVYWITGGAHQRNNHRKCTQWSTKY